MNRLFFGILILLMLIYPFNRINAVEKHPFEAKDLVTLSRLSQVQASPNGRFIVYVKRVVDVKSYKVSRKLWMLDLENQSLIPKQLTFNKGSDFSPQWSNDGKHVYYLSSRSGSTQVWRVNIYNSSTKPITDFEIDVNSMKLSNLGSMMAITMRMHPECKTLSCTKKHLDETSHLPSGKVYDKLMVRHWDTWDDGLISRLFLYHLNEKKEKRLIDVSGSIVGNVPSKPFGGSSDYTFSPDDSRIFFTARLANKNEAWSTNFDVYEAQTHGGKPQNITADNNAWDTHPVVSPDGKYLAYLAMKRPGFEADKFDVVLKNLKTNKQKRITEEWDHSVSHFEFTSDSKYLMVNAYHFGQKPLFKINIATQVVTQLTPKGTVSEFAVTKDKVIYGLNDLSKPTEYFSIAITGGNARQITHSNQVQLEALQMGQYEQFRFKGWNKEDVHGYLVKPVNFKKGVKYPIAFLIHGGPQGSFGNRFHFRWNPQTYAAQGYAVVFIDFHGSVGYGQKFTDSISGDWGGKPLIDLQLGLKHIIDKNNWMDGEKVCALGASYGGYMVNWIAGNWSDRFKCLVNHDGIFDSRMMYYSTEELWFPEWEHGGPYYDRVEQYEKYNPANYVKQWQTPMLVIQGGLDFRIPETQALATFTALQRQNIESRLLYFPHENHWVLKPKNSIQWHEEVNRWLAKYLK